MDSKVWEAEGKGHGFEFVFFLGSQRTYLTHL